MIDYDTPIYPIREAAEASGFTLGTLRSYFQRGHFRMLGADKVAESKGLPHHLSLRTIMGLAVAHRLWRRGTDAWLAFRAGQNFAHFAEDVPGLPDREPGTLFDTDVGFTVLLWFDADVIKVVPLPRRGAIDFVTLFIHPQTGERCESTALLLNDVERQVFLALRVGERTVTDTTDSSAMDARDGERAGVGG